MFNQGRLNELKYFFPCKKVTFKTLVSDFLNTAQCVGWGRWKHDDACPSHKVKIALMVTRDVSRSDTPALF